MFITPLLTAIGYLFYLIRLTIPYMLMYMLACIFLNLPAYKKRNIINEMAVQPALKHFLCITRFLGVYK